MVAVATLLPDGKRLHLNHGPIDLVIEATGERQQVAQAYDAARFRFASVLDELVQELPVLRTEIPQDGLSLRGKIARDMERAVVPHWAMRVTPMAAVAGAVAHEILQTMTTKAILTRAYVNNGGDIALHLEEGGEFVVASAAGPICVTAGNKVRGIATSGWRGRSFSLGIADSVTVLARCAADADVAATLIANAVDLPGSSKIKRQRALEIAPDSDLGQRLVTAAVMPLTPLEVSTALSEGQNLAQELMRQGFIIAASLQLAGEVRHSGARFVQQQERLHA